MKFRTAKLYLLIILFTFMSAINWKYLVGFPNPINKVNLNTLFDGRYLLSFIVMLCLIYKRKLIVQLLVNRKWSWVSMTIAGLFTVSTLIGLVFDGFGTLDTLYQSKMKFVLFIILLVGLFYLFAGMTEAIFGILDKLYLKRNNIFNSSRYFLKGHFLFFGVIMLGWAPYIISQFPGTMSWDGLSQLNYFFHIEPFVPITNQHPFLSTLVLGSIMKLGMIISDNTGVFLNIFIQSVICAGVFSAISLEVKKTFGQVAGWVSVLFYAAVPIWGIYAQTLGKDTLYFGIFAWFVLLVYQYLQKPQVSTLWIITFAGLLVTLLRNNGIYLVVPTIVCFLFMRPSLVKIRHIIAALFVIIAVTFGFNHVVLPINHVAPASKAEPLSIPLQQVGRVTRDHPNSITKNEAHIINKVIPYKNLGTRYNPIISDPIKYTFRAKNSAEIAAFLRVWLVLGVQHPIDYGNATIANTYLYYYPWTSTIPNTPFYESYKVIPKSVNTGSFRRYHYVFTQKFTHGLYHFAEEWRVLPILGMLMNNGIYYWLSLLFIGWLLLRKKFHNLILFVPVFMNFLVSIASPVNGLLRYTLPVIAIVPLLFVVLVINNPKNNKTRSKK